MKVFHINTGRGFSRPYESDYAILRRCIIANPGIPLTAIEACLRETDPDTEFVIERIKNLENNRTQQEYVLNIPDTYRRQCPTCAGSLYHTDVYALSWLTKCPIHHCDLTTICPTCHLPWPDKHELLHRNCQTCGVLSLKTIQDSIISNIRSKKYTSIKSIYDFMHCDLDNKVKLNCNDIRRLRNNLGFSFNDYWWKIISPNNIQYPSFQKYRAKGYGVHVLEKLHIANSFISKKTSNLHIDKLTKYTRGEYHTKYSKYARWFIETVKEIIRWIGHKTQKTHELHLTDYHHLGLEEIILKQKICPYCTAFSVWFYHYATEFNGYDSSYREYKYEFLESSGLNSFYCAGEPCITTNNNHIYKLGNRFNKWFYRRGLIISFLHILKHMISLTEKINNTSADANRYLYIDYRVNNEIRDYQLCSFEIINDRLEFYYESPNPLYRYQPPISPNLTPTCKAYHKEYFEKNTSYPEYFFNYMTEIYNKKLMNSIVNTICKQCTGYKY